MTQFIANLLKGLNLIVIQVYIVLRVGNYTSKAACLSAVVYHWRLCEPYDWRMLTEIHRLTIGSWAVWQLRALPRGGGEMKDDCSAERDKSVSVC